MPTTLTHNAYGKSHVRLTKVVRNGSRHELLEMSVDIRLEGDFADSYTSGDNSKVVATDSMKNTVYVLAREQTFDSIDTFAAALASHFVSTYSQVSTATIDIEQSPWGRIKVGGKAHDHAFVACGLEKRTARVVLARQRPLQHQGGVAGLHVLKTTGSEFRDFVTDRYRTLKDTSDRIFATSVDAQWTYGSDGQGAAPKFNADYATIRSVMLETFASHHSLAVQQTLLAMGEAVLAAVPGISTVTLTMPNQHRIPFSLEPFGLANQNDIFVPTDEPYGLISGTVERG